MEGEGKAKKSLEGSVRHPSRWGHSGLTLARVVGRTMVRCAMGRWGSWCWRLSVDEASESERYDGVASTVRWTGGGGEWLDRRDCELIGRGEVRGGWMDGWPFATTLRTFCTVAASVVGIASGQSRTSTCPRCWRENESCRLTHLRAPRMRSAPFGTTPRRTTWAACHGPVAYHTGLCRPFSRPENSDG